MFTYFSEKFGAMTTPRKAKQKFSWMVFALELSGKVGTGGAVIIILITFFIIEGSDQQHKDFFDRYILLKSPECQPTYLFVVIISLLIILIGTWIFSSKRIKLQEERLSNHLEEIGRLQNILTKK